MKVSVTDFKARCLSLLEDVHKTGIPLQITKHNRVIARVVPDSEDLKQKPWKALLGSGQMVGDPFEPVINDDEINALK